MLVGLSIERPGPKKGEEGRKVILHISTRDVSDQVERAEAESSRIED